MAITMIYGPTEEDEIHNDLLMTLLSLKVISHKIRGDALKGLKISMPGSYSMSITDIAEIKTIEKLEKKL